MSQGPGVCTKVGILLALSSMLYLHICMVVEFQESGIFSHKIPDMHVFECTLFSDLGK